MHPCWNHGAAGGYRSTHSEAGCYPTKLNDPRSVTRAFKIRAIGATKGASVGDRLSNMDVIWATPSGECLSPIAIRINLMSLLYYA